MGNTDEGAAREDLWRTLQIVMERIRVADTKAGATLAVDGAILAVVAARLRGFPTLGLPAVVALSVAITLAAASVLLAVWTVVPRARRLSIDSIAHYGTIAAFDSAASYRAAALATLADLDDLTVNLTRHIWAFSRTVMRKYTLVTWAIRLLAGAVLVGVLALLLP